VLIIGVYALWTRPSGGVVIGLALVLLGLLAIIELLRRGADLPAADPPATTVPIDLPAMTGV